MDSVFFKYIDKEKVQQKLASGEFPFSKYLFWDTSIENIDVKKHKEYIVERVVLRGKIEDFYLLLQLYTIDEIKASLILSRELDPKTAHFCCTIFNIPKSQLYVSPYYS